MTIISLMQYFSFILIFNVILRGVWECDSDCFLKCFFARKCIKIIYILKNLFLTSAHQNDFKTLKII
jgi:hypothetical protein